VIGVGQKGKTQMGAVIYDSTDSIQQLIDQGSEMPIYFAAMGIDGSVVTGTYRRSRRNGGFDCQITAQTKENSLMPPINIMYVDRRGVSALIVVRQLP
jgi:hypothetical protein